MSTATATTVVLVGNPRAGSRTSRLATTLVDRLAPALPEGGPGEVEVLELADIAATTFGPDAVAPSAPHPDPWGAVRAARLLVVATPTYKGTYTGLLKLLLDGFDTGDLAGVVAVPVAIAGKPDHRDSVAADLARVLTELGAQPTPPLALLEPEVADLDAAVAAWVERHGTDVAGALTAEVAR